MNLLRTSERPQNRPVVLIKILSLFLLLAAVGCSKDPAPADDDTTLTLQTFAPTHAIPGATVVLTGKNFSTVKLDNHVKFQGSATDATVLNATATRLEVVVPATAVSGKITITVGSQTIESSAVFFVDTETTSITDFTPKQGSFGTVVTITGRLFGNDIKVSLNDVEATVTQKNATQIVFTVPENTSLSVHKIKVISDGSIIQSSGFFTVNSTGPYALWLKKNVNAAPAAIFQFGLSFVYKNKIYWGFSKLSFNQPAADYMILDPSAATLQWVLGTPPPADIVPPTLQSAVAVVHNDKVYIGTGLAPTSTNAWWQYNPETNTGTRLADYPEPAAHALAFVLNNTIYAGFGGTSQNLHSYNPATNTWDLAAVANTREISDANAFIINNEAFIGRALLTPGGERKDFLRFTGTNALTAVTGLPEGVPVAGTSSFTLGNKGYFVAGAKVWEYTPGANGGTWRLVFSVVDGPVIKHTAVVTINNLPVVYGWTASGELYEFKIN